MPKWFTNIIYAFPIRLLILHFRSNLLLIGMWLFVVFLITGLLGKELGFLYLFLEPEYLGNVNFWSFLVIGLAFGGFLMTWNLTAYLLTAHHFPFLASLHHPFTKFCINNLIIPISFMAFYLTAIISFQINYEVWSLEELFYHSIGFLTGMLSLLLFYFLYFHYTNQDISSFDGKHKEKANEQNINPGRRKVDLDYIKMDANRLRVDYYLTETFGIRLVRSVAHYDVKMMKRIFRQNHLNALVIQLLTMIVLFTLGSLMELSLFRIPAGASIFILLSIIVALVGAVTYWFDEWRATIIIILLIGINYFTQIPGFRHINKAYGLTYEEKAAPYSNEILKSLCLPDQIADDKAATIKILDKWKKKNTTDSLKKPKIIFIGVSGGGLRAAAWTVNVIQKADNLTKGELFDKTILITGASGGMLGLSYMRELFLQKQNDPHIDVYSEKHFNIISKDLLNSIAFTLVSNDLFLPWTTFDFGAQTYRKDRGYIFEQQLNENTNYILDKPLIDYRIPEQEAKIPMMFLTPAIVNDARRLIISPQAVSYMMVAPAGLDYERFIGVDAVDFGLLLKEQKADSLRFLSALRMNATFPYIMPNVYLPTDPEIAAVDAGFLDNYGLLSASRFIQVFRSWILENTSGVIFIQITSSHSDTQISLSNDKGAVQNIFNPIGIAGQIFNLQEYEQDNSMGFVYDLLGKENFNFIRFKFDPGDDKKVKASISFHLTDHEKILIKKEIDSPDNKSQLRQLQELLR